MIQRHVNLVVGHAGEIVSLLGVRGDYHPGHTLLLADAAIEAQRLDDALDGGQGRNLSTILVEMDSH